jgi:hypothetical protein
MMKKLYFFLLLLPLWGSGNFASAQVSVELTGKTYTVPYTVSPQVSFTVSWETKAPYDNKIWVLAQYSASGIVEDRALITDVSATGATASTVTGHRGFWLETSGDSGSATVTATLKLADGVEQFNWCVYAFDYPPNAVLQSDGTYQLHGTPPFTINGDITEPTNTFGLGTCITSFTDATDNPEGHIISPPFSAGEITTANVSTEESVAPTINPANAMEASGGDGNIMYEWRRSGTSSATFSDANSSGYDISSDATNYNTAGAYYFTRYAKDGTCNTTFTASGGQYTLWVSFPSVISADTWTCGTQLWSDVLIEPAGCAKTTSLSTSTPPAQYITFAETPGFYYNWTCVDLHGDTLCPSPWRVPSRTDLDNISVCGGLTWRISNWPAYGFVQVAALQNNGLEGTIWSSTRYSTTYAWRANWYLSGVGSVSDNPIHLGHNVRCVMNLP